MVSLILKNAAKSGNIHQSPMRGFTIVELLIVIVVIGILAAIVIVAYQGVTSRANDTGYKTDAVSIQKVLEAANGDNGSYPQTAAAIAAYTGARLPANVSVFFPTTTPPANTVSTAAGAPAVTVTNALYTDSATKIEYYAAKACGASVGMMIYYPQSATGGALGTIKVGAGC